jgi:hypothetical protein
MSEHVEAGYDAARSGGSANDCLEVADGFPGVMPVRDSKVPHGAALSFPADAWTTFVGAVKAGTLP